MLINNNLYSFGHESWLYIWKRTGAASIHNIYYNLQHNTYV